MHRSKVKALAVLCVALFACDGLAVDPVLTPAKAKRVKLEARQIYNRLLGGTCWIRVRTLRTIHSGTGWIVDLKRRLIVTNHHVVNGQIDMRIYFPEYQGTGDDRRVVSDPKHYTVQKAHRAKVIDSSRHYDLALLQLNRIPAGMKALPIATKSAFPADKLHIVGGKPKGSDGLWTYGFGACRAVNKQRIATGSVIRILQTQGGSDHGNSGGAVLNDYGEVVGVVEGARADAKDVGMSVDVMEVRAWLAKTLPLLERRAKRVAQDSGSTGTRTKGTAVSTNQKSRIDGKWKFNGKVGKNHRRFTLTFGKGRYTLQEHVHKSGKWQPARDEEGPFLSSSRRIYFRGQRIVARDYSFRGEKLAIEFKDLGYRLLFRKVK